MEMVCEATQWTLEILWDVWRSARFEKEEEHCGEVWWYTVRQTVWSLAHEWRRHFKKDVATRLLVDVRNCSERWEFGRMSVEGSLDSLMRYLFEVRVKEIENNWGKMGWLRSPFSNRVRDKWKLVLLPERSALVEQEAVSFLRHVRSGVKYSMLSIWPSNNFSMILFRCAIASSICLFIPAGGGSFAGRCAEIEGVIGKDGLPFRFKW